MAVKAGAAVVLLALAGCGYRFTAGESSLPGGSRSVFAPLFVNRTAEPALEASFTQAFREQLVRAGVAGGPESDTRVEGELLTVSGAPNLWAPSHGLASYRLSAVVQLRLKKGDQLLSEAQLTGNESYPAGADVLSTEGNRQAALRRLAEQMMRDGYARLATAW